MKSDSPTTRRQKLQVMTELSGLGINAPAWFREYATLANFQNVLAIAREARRRHVECEAAENKRLARRIVDGGERYED
jgi:hypothetical protein